MCDLVKNILQAYLFDAVGSEAQKNSSAVLSWTHSLSSRSSSARRLIETFPEAEFENLSELRGLSLELNSARGVASRPFPPRSMRIWLEGEFLEELQIFVHEGEPVEIQGYTLKPGGTLNPSTASEASLLSARKWLDDCLASHLKCGSAQAARLPKRVLDISNNKIRLYEPSSVDETGRYVCLSYCWGPPPWFRTTPDTKPDRLKNIPWEHLPKTFQDVVSVTRQLGIQFLWIDALCIIQDDEADWEEQSSQMASIYEHCHLTICADRSPDVHSGIFSAETEPHHELAVTRDGDHKTVPAFVRVPVRHMITSDKDSTRERLFPLETRAWAYQEYLLSPRSLHFGAQELFFTCRETWLPTCECGIPPSTPPHLEDIQTQRLHSSARSPTKKWHNVVRNYTARTLTKPKDKLPAISGLAQYIQRQRPNDRYLAGLWRTTLLDDLTWHFHSPRALRLHPAAAATTTLPLGTTPPAPPRAPSWSWAALDHPRTDCLTWPRASPKHHLIRTFCTVHAATCQPAGGVIDISGPLLPAVLRAEPGGRRGVYGVRVAGGQAVAFVPDGVEYVDVPDGSAGFACLLLKELVGHRESARGMLVLERQESPTEEQLYKRVGFVVAEVRNPDVLPDGRRRARKPDVADPEVAARLARYAFQWDGGRDTRIKIV